MANVTEEFNDDIYLSGYTGYTHDGAVYNIELRSGSFDEVYDGLYLDQFWWGTIANNYDNITKPFAEWLHDGYGEAGGTSRLASNKFISSGSHISAYQRVRGQVMFPGGFNSEGRVYLYPADDTYNGSDYATDYIEENPHSVKYLFPFAILVKDKEVKDKEGNSPPCAPGNVKVE